MKNLFRNRFPFVELPDEELSEDQLHIKKMYERNYQEVVPKEETQYDRLREVRVNDEPTRKRGKR